MKPETKAAIKLKFSTFNLSAERIEKIGAFLEPKITDDKTLDALLTTFADNNDIAQIAKDDDAMRGAKAKIVELSKAKPVDPAKPGPAQPAEPDFPEGTPEWMKTQWKQQQAQMTQLMQTVTTLANDKNTTVIKTKAVEQLKDIPESYWSNWQLPAKEEELAGFVENVTTQYGAFTKDLTAKGFKNMPVPASAGGGGKQQQQRTDVVSPEVKMFAEKTAKQNTATEKTGSYSNPNARKTA